MAKKTAPLQMSKAVAELERCFDLFNKALYSGKLPTPLMTVQSTGRMSAYGWFCGGAWKGEGKDETLPEINICAEHLARPINDIMSTLIHEMVHLDNFASGISDCNANQYHNKKFKVAAEKIGFTVEKLPKYGYARTHLTPELEKLIKQAKPSEEAFAAFRLTAGKSQKAKGSKLKLWTCGCVKIRVAVSEFDATCNACGNDFKCVDPSVDESGED